MVNDSFKFDLNAKRIKVTDNDMIHSLQRYYDLMKQPFTTEEYDRWDDRICASCTIINRFDSWRKALAKIGITSGIRAYKYTTEELIDNLEIVWRELGYPPGKRMLSKHGYRISERPYNDRWGSVANACKQLKLFKEGKIKQSELLRTPRTAERKSIPLSVRWAVMQRDNFRCMKCGRRPPEIKLQVDHVVPLSKGGPDIEDNFQTLCNECNAGKSNRDE
jgi:hypothetical protein